MGKTVFIAEIDPDELAVRLMETSLGAKRGGDKRPVNQILDDAESTWPVGAGRFPFRIMAHRALAYVSECIEKGNVPS